MMDEALLDKTERTDTNARIVAKVTEWHYQGELVKRDIEVTPIVPKGSP